MAVDLKIRKFDLPSGVVAGDKVNPKALIQNDGSTPISTPFKVQFVVVNGSQIGDDITIDSLGPGEEKEVRAENTGGEPAFWSAVEGSSELRVLVDPDLVTGDPNTADNTRDRLIVVGPQPEGPEPSTIPLELRGGPTPFIGLQVLRLRDQEGPIPVLQGIQRPSFIFHLWRDLDDAVGVELTDRATRAGNAVGEVLRDFPETFKFIVRASQVDPPIVDSQGFHQNLTLKTQIDLARKLRGASVRVVTTKHGIATEAIVREVRVVDRGEWNNYADIQFEIRQVPGVGLPGGSDIRLGELVPADAQDPGDSPIPDEERTLISAGLTQCTRTTTVKESMLQLLNELSGDDGAEEETGAESEEAEVNWVNLGPAFEERFTRPRGFLGLRRSANLDEVTLEEFRKRELVTFYRGVIQTESDLVDQDRDYRFTPDGELEINITMFQRFPPPPSKLRCV